VLAVIHKLASSGQVWVGNCFFWHQPTQVDPDRGPLNGCMCVYVADVLLFVCAQAVFMPSKTTAFKTKRKIPRRRVVVFPDEICAAIWRPTAGSFVDTTLCGPIKPIVYTFDSPSCAQTSTNYKLQTHINEHHTFWVRLPTLAVCYSVVILNVNNNTSCWNHITHTYHLN